MKRSTRIAVSVRPAHDLFLGSGLLEDAGRVGVNAAQIARALQEKGFRIDEKMVRLPAPLKEIGVFDVPLHLHQDVDATVKVWVVQAKPS